VVATTPTPVEVATTPTPVEVATTPTPVEVATTPTPVDVATTPTPVDVATTPTPVAVATTPTPVAVATTPTPVEVATTPTPVEVATTPTPAVATTPIPVAVATTPVAVATTPTPAVETTPVAAATTPAPVLVATTPRPAAYVVKMAVVLPLTRQAFNGDEQLKFKQSVARAAGVSSDDVSITGIVDVYSTLAARRRLLTTGIRVDTSVSAPNEVTAVAISTSLTLESLNSALVEVGLSVSATTILEAGSPGTNDPGTVYVPPSRVADTTPMRTTTLALATTRAAATTPKPALPPTTPKPAPPPTTPAPDVPSLKRELVVTTPTPALATAPADAQTGVLVGAIVGVLAFFCVVVSLCLWFQTRKGRQPS
jgi:hypothetical protein